MKTVNNKTSYGILSQQIDRIIEKQKVENISKIDIDICLAVAKATDVQVRMLNYELNRSIKTGQPIREIESKSFDSTI